MRQWSKVATRSDRALFRDEGPHPVIQHVDQKLNGFETDPAESKRKNIRPKQHHGADLGLCERTPNSTGVAADKVDLKLLKLICRNVNVGQFPEAGCNSVNDVTSRHNLLHHPARGEDLSMRVWRN